jgi:hypothetical protein
MAGTCSSHLQVHSPMFVNVVRGAPKGIPPVGFPQVWLFPCTNTIGYKSSFSASPLQIPSALNTFPFTPLCRVE